ncbi:MAG: hypothetical protein KKC77_19555, partial [Proteobacteria bacterium]|nr:hypothetical protein [Pseudomonadota bacterium]
NIELPNANATPDSTAPGVVDDLSAATGTGGGGRCNLTWTSTGDDAGSPDTGTPRYYDIRYSESDITDQTDFDNATEVTGEPNPSVAGTSEAMTVTGLTANTLYYFAIEVTDEADNTSALSNVDSETSSDAPAGNPVSMSGGVGLGAGCSVH